MCKQSLRQLKLTCWTACLSNKTFTQNILHCFGICSSTFFILLLSTCIIFLFLNSSAQTSKLFQKPLWISLTPRVRAFVNQSFYQCLLANPLVVCCYKLNSTWDCDEHLFREVSTHTGRYQLPIFRCTNLHPWRCARLCFRRAVYWWRHEL